MNSRHLLLLLPLLTSAEAIAETADDNALGEIVVTAQRREERLQDVPAAITALSGEALSRQHLLGNADLAAQVPSLSFTVQGPGESTLAIRGLGTAYGLAPAVSYYINETSAGYPYRWRSRRAGRRTSSMSSEWKCCAARQGTLYGSSSMGGALRILTAQPDPTAFAAKAETGVSTMKGGGMGYSGKAAVNVPLGTEAAVRLVGAFEHIGATSIAPRRETTRILHPICPSPSGASTMQISRARASWDCGPQRPGSASSPASPSRRSMRAAPRSTSTICPISPRPEPMPTRWTASWSLAIC